MSRKKVVTLDVRAEIRAGREPFGKIMQAVSALNEQEDLLLVAPFEPRPLYGVLAEHGFNYQPKELPAGDWEVLFTRGSSEWATPQNTGRQAMPGGLGVAEKGASGPKGSRSAKAPAETAALDVDARGLEPPQPLVKILEAVAALPEGGQLRALTERRPMHLYAHLEERGCTWETAEQPDGSFITHVRRQ